MFLRNVPVRTISIEREIFRHGEVSVIVPSGKLRTLSARTPFPRKKADDAILSVATDPVHKVQYLSALHMKCCDFNALVWACIHSEGTVFLRV